MSVVVDRAVDVSATFVVRLHLTGSDLDEKQLVRTAKQLVEAIGNGGAHVHGAVFDNVNVDGPDGN